ncbi:GumC family protein [Microvirga puerhi]|uniref:Lipopolysaccharide biosynthesis protein n=1 Tax=Microvirga puerhi TaxID=2876078 RepID=A0ABS7VWP6_9HYPH|nr:lipopolysaccharide biosynthesis protein [Microvirga puerhi]MBZ6079387.1 lipopolysaccharide biosynthesis protein [Microvirga puerhi]
MSRVDIRFYASLFLRKIHYFLAIVVLISGMGIAVAHLLPPTYQANARILVESPQISTDLVRPVVPDEIFKQLQTIELQMMTRANLLALADRLGLYKDIPNASESDIADDIRSRMSIEQIQFDVPRGRDAALAFNISYKARDPVIAADIVNEFARILLRKNAEMRTGQAGETLQFFQQETEKLSTRLAQIESEISSFKKENRDALPEGTSFRSNQQLTLQERLMQLSREETSLHDGRMRLLQMYASTGRVANADAMTPEERTLEQLRKVLVEQRTIYSETSPAISALQSQIASLDRTVKDMGAGDIDASGGKPLPPELNIQLADMDRRLALIADEKPTIEHKLAELNRSIAATPANEATLNSLDRQRQSIQSQYNAAASRLADASTGDRIEQRSKGERLSVLDFATPPQHPVGPKRFAIALGSVVASLILGLGLIVVLEFLNKTVRRPAELLTSLEIEPLETIPYISSPGEVRSVGLKVIPAMLRRSSGM